GRIGGEEAGGPFLGVVACLALKLGAAHRCIVGHHNILTMAQAISARAAQVVASSAISAANQYTPWSPSGVVGSPPRAPFATNARRVRRRASPVGVLALRQRRPDDQPICGQFRAV